MDQSILSLALGVGLAAACGFRIFVPGFLASLAARGGQLELAAGFDWLSGDLALGVLGVAALVEFLAYLIPGVDHLLDTIAIPAATLAGTLLAAAVFVEMTPTVRWVLAAIAGGGSAGLLQAGTGTGRWLSTLSSGGFANPLYSTVEFLLSAATAILAILAPVLVFFVVLIALVFALRQLMRRRAVGDGAV